MNFNDKVKFAIVGCGYIGLKHATLIAENKEAELVALCDIKGKQTISYSKFSDFPFFNNIEDLLKSNLDFNTVNICTPNGLHVEQTIQALEANKHVVVEKPLGLHKNDCEKIIHKASAVSKHVFCVMQNRYSPPSVWLKEVIDQKILGKIYLVQINCYWNRDERYYKKENWKGTKVLDGGVLFTQFSHFIDMMYWLFGDIKNIHANIKNFSHEKLTEFDDSGFVSFDFVNGGIGSINFSTSVYDKNLESSISIIAENGSIKIGGQYMNEVEYCHIKNYSMPQLPESNPPNDYGTYKGSAANHNYVIQNVIDTIKGHTTVSTTVEEGIKVVDIIERIYASSKKL